MGVFDSQASWMLGRLLGAQALGPDCRSRCDSQMTSVTRHLPTDDGVQTHNLPFKWSAIAVSGRRLSPTNRKQLQVGNNYLMYKVSRGGTVTDGPPREVPRRST